jgi:hypothetical protein
MSLTVSNTTVPTTQLMITQGWSLTTPQTIVVVGVQWGSNSGVWVPNVSLYSPGGTTATTFTVYYYYQ